jgi:hypothetical protein
MIPLPRPLSHKVTKSQSSTGPTASANQRCQAPPPGTQGVAATPAARPRCAETEPEQSSHTTEAGVGTRWTWDDERKLRLLQLQASLYHSSFYASHTFRLGFRPDRPKYQTTQHDRLRHVTLSLRSTSSPASKSCAATSPCPLPFRVASRHG